MAFLVLMLVKLALLAPGALSPVIGAAKPARPGKAVDMARVVNLEPYKPPPYERFAQAEQAPLFFASRRMPGLEAEEARSGKSRKKPEKSALPEPSAKEVVVRGIMVDSGRRRVFLQAPGEKPRWLSAGGKIHGWRIEKINSHGVVLRRRGRQVFISLYPGNKGKVLHFSGRRPKR